MKIFIDIVDYEFTFGLLSRLFGIYRYEQNKQHNKLNKKIN